MPHWRFRRSVRADIVGEVAHRLIDPEQCLAWRPFGVDDVMSFELEMEELKLIARVGRIERNRPVVHQASCRNENIIEKQGVPLSHVEIRVWNPRGQRRCRNPNRSCLLRPGLCRITPDTTKTANPLNGACASETRRHQVADPEILDVAFAGRRQNPGPPQEALAVSAAMSIASRVMSTIMVPATMMIAAAVIAMVSAIPSIVIIMRRCRIRKHQLFDERKRSQRADRLEIPRQKRAARRRPDFCRALDGFTHT
jgi:hypothetical protein